MNGGELRWSSHRSESFDRTGLSRDPNLGLPIGPNAPARHRAVLEAMLPLTEAPGDLGPVLLEYSPPQHP